MTILLEIIFVISIAVIWIVPGNAETFPQGVRINGETMGGLTSEEAVGKLANANEHVILNRQIFLTDGSKEWTINTGDYGFKYNYSETVRALLEEMQWDQMSEEVIQCVKLQAQNVDRLLELSWDETKLDLHLQELNEEMLVPAQEARVEFTEAGIVIKEEKNGKQIDIKGTRDKLIRALQSNNRRPQKIVWKSIVPPVTSSDLEGIDGVLVAVSTELTSDENRSSNIERAAQLLDGRVLMPGETFSFNEQLGERTLEKGYKPAPIIMNNAVYYDIGGGICQLASTLYNASLLAGLEIVERKPHSMPVKYVPPGKDATVYYGQIDLKIRNNRVTPLVINSTIEERSLVIKIWGKQLG
ncbi:MAG: VanW family protein [Bacillota bacterium]|nr:VanW family protein [Bacillota bacterium]